ncbi:hypothetical protein BKA70DRAFT_1213926 [Coprinopsis sp. MPI-PUGE-AT-0042]|nr:hypothetical protein BKA70DRAFT_1213926 [Coprinopsis sp. MPI-PUGE-AT-0042]
MPPPPPPPAEGDSQSPASHRKRRQEKKKKKKDSDEEESTRFTRDLAEFAADETRLAHLLSDIAEMDAAVEDRATPGVQKARKRIKLDWESFVRIVGKITPGREWTTTTVIQHSTGFWTTSIEIKRGRDNWNVSAVTLNGWRKIFFGLLGRYMQDPETGMLVDKFHPHRRDVFDTVLNGVHTVCREFKLVRHIKAKIYFGFCEISILITCSLESTIDDGPRRLGHIQNITSWLFTASFTLRPSSMGYGSQRSLEGGQYIMLEHLTFERIGPTGVKTLVKVLNFKHSINTIVGDSRDYPIDPVLHAGNMQFDLSVYLMVMLFSLGVMDTHHKTYSAAVLDKDWVPRIKTDCKKLPLFRALAPSARGFIEPVEPAHAHHFTDSIREACAAAGLPTVGMTALRRDAANDYCKKLGKATAQVLMHHSNSTNKVINNHYLRGPVDEPLINLRLNEVNAQGEQSDPNAPRDLGPMVLFSAALQHMMKDFVKSKEENKAEKQAREQEIVDAANAQLAPIDKQLTGYWDGFLKCVSMKPAPGRTDADLPTQSSTTIFNLWAYISNPNAVQPLVYSVTVRHGKLDKAKGFHDLYVALATNRRAEYRRLIKEANQDTQREMTRSFLRGDLHDGNYEQRAQALEELTKPINPQDLLASFTSISTLTASTSTTSTLTASTSTTSTLAASTSTTSTLAASTSTTSTLAASTSTTSTLAASTSTASTSTPASASATSTLNLPGATINLKELIGQDGKVSADISKLQQLETSFSALWDKNQILDTLNNDIDDVYTEIDANILKDVSPEARRAHQEFEHLAVPSYPTVADDMEPQETLPEPIPHDESLYPNPLGMISIDAMRIAFAQYLERPIIKHEAVEQLRYSELAEGGPAQCPRRYRVSSVLLTILAERLQEHSQWKKLLAACQSKANAKLWICSGPDCSFTSIGKTNRGLANHMSGSKTEVCPNKEMFIPIFEAHNKAVAKFKDTGVRKFQARAMASTSDDEEDKDEDEEHVAPAPVRRKGKGKMVPPLSEEEDEDGEPAPARGKGKGKMVPPAL